jgi:hypothetical protein
MGLLLGTATVAASPELYRNGAYESPVRGDPDDLLLLAGYGFAVDDTVVYRAVRSNRAVLATPDQIPAQATAESGVAPIVSTADAPYSLTIRLPQSMRADQTYALWVRDAGGEWSEPVKINDARPLWVSPAYVYVTGMPADLPRELKVVGRNLQPAPGGSTRVRLLGPQRFTGTVLSDAGSSKTLDSYVARVRLPPTLLPGRYRIQVNRDGASWVEVDGQRLDVLQDPTPPAEFSVGDPRYGGCRPDDGVDDTACIVRAIAAAERAVRGTVYFGPGTWDLINGGQPGLIAGEGILVPAGVRLRGAGSDRTRVDRHTDWNARAATPAFTLEGHTVVSDFAFRDLQSYRPRDVAGAFLQVGENWQRAASIGGAAATAASDVVITRNTFDRVYVAIGAGGVPIDRLFITHDTFGAYYAALELSGDQYDTIFKYRLDDSIIDDNVFNPGSRLDLMEKTGTLASEVGAGHRVDFSANAADGASTRYLYDNASVPDNPASADNSSPPNTPDYPHPSSTPRGWRAAFFWNPNNNVEEVLVSQNTASCTGDKIGDGEAIALDNNTNTFAFTSAPTVVEASRAGFGVTATLVSRQHDRDVPVATFYVGHWVRVVGGPGLGQARKITGYSTDSTTRITRFNIEPAWDVTPVAGETRVSIGREYWQFYAVGNHIDNRRPLCQKSNRSRRAAGQIVWWAQSADSVIAGNYQHDSDGIFVQQNYVTPQHPCADCAMEGYFQSFLEIRENKVDGEYDWGTDCSASGIEIGTAAAPWEKEPPPTVGFGVSISHNTIRRADGLHGGAISQLNSWIPGPEPHRWPLSDNLLIHHNSISDIDGPRAAPTCGSNQPRIGIAFPEPEIAWRTVLYANSCKSVSVPVSAGGIDTVKVCPSSAPDSCECAPRAPQPPMQQERSD